jgi:hypothetical protein
MAHEETNLTDRRTFLQAGALATASALGTAPGLRAQDAAPKPSELPRRPLGKTERLDFARLLPQVERHLT